MALSKIDKTAPREKTSNMNARDHFQKNLVQMFLAIYNVHISKSSICDASCLHHRVVFVTTKSTKHHKPSFKV